MIQTQLPVRWDDMWSGSLEGYGDHPLPIPSMYGLFPFIYAKNQPNIYHKNQPRAWFIVDGKKPNGWWLGTTQSPGTTYTIQTIHGWYGYGPAWASSPSANLFSCSLPEGDIHVTSFAQRELEGLGCTGSIRKIMGEGYIGKMTSIWMFLEVRFWRSTQEQNPGKFSNEMVTGSIFNGIWWIIPGSCIERYS